MPARVYNALLGGFHNFQSDREMAGTLCGLVPEVDYWAWQGRLFLTRALRYIVGRGVRQILDIGCGVPTMVASVHHTAWRVDASTRIVYVDHDPEVVAAGRDLARDDRVTVTAGDLRRPDELLSDSLVVAAVDWSRPVAVVLGAVLHFVADRDDPAAILDTLRGVLAAGSYLVLSHASPPEDATVGQERATREYTTRTAPLALRSRPQVQELVTAPSWRLVSPGVVRPAHWRPEPGVLDTPDEAERAERIPGWVAVAVKEPPTAPHTGSQAARSGDAGAQSGSASGAVDSIRDGGAGGGVVGVR